MELHRIPLFHTSDIVGYELNTDFYCVGDCVTDALNASPPLTGLTAHVEQRLDEIAASRGINRHDERSYDSSVFPKIVTAGSEPPDYCPMCAGCHAPLDSFDPADYATADESEN